MKVDFPLVEILNHVIEFIRLTIDFIVHIDVHLAQILTTMGWGIYPILFLIVFCETGLVITPFLPGDSLLFAAGALAGMYPDQLNVGLLAGLLFVAGVLGDAVNYAIGHRVGPKIFERKNSRFLNQQHLQKTQAFYEKHGKKTIILARFVPIIRTFAPFVAGIGKMKYRDFAAYNVIGAFLWVGIFTIAGYIFGDLPVVKERFHLVIIAIIGISVIPIIIEFIRGYRDHRKSSVSI